MVAAGTYYVAKYTPDGAFAWATPFGAVGDASTSGLAADNLGNIYVTGTAGVTKLDASNGNTLWVRGLGGSGSSQVRGVAVDGNSVYATGRFSGQVDFDPSPNSTILTSTGKGNNRPDDAFVWRLTADGTFVSAWGIGGASADVGENILAANGSIYVSGSFQGPVDFDPSPTAPLNRTSVKGSGNAYTSAWFVAKYTPNAGGLTPNWVQTIDVIAANASNGLGNNQGMAVDANSLYLPGRFNGTVDFDRNNVFSYDTLASVAGSSDAFIAKYNLSNGALAWVRAVGGPDNDQAGFSVAVTDTGMVYIGGAFSQTADFDPASTSTAWLTSQGGFDGFILQLDTNGNYINAWRLGGAGWDTSRVLGVYEDQLYATGRFSGTADFPTGGTLTSFGSDDIALMAPDLGSSSALMAPSSSDAAATDAFFVSGQTTQTLDADILAALVSLDKKR